MLRAPTSPKRGDNAEIDGRSYFCLPLQLDVEAVLGLELLWAEPVILVYCSHDMCVSNTFPGDHRCLLLLCARELPPAPTALGPYPAFISCSQPSCLTTVSWRRPLPWAPIALTPR